MKSHFILPIVFLFMLVLLFNIFDHWLIRDSVRDIEENFNHKLAVCQREIDSKLCQEVDLLTMKCDRLNDELGEMRTEMARHRQMLSVLSDSVDDFKRASDEHNRTINPPNKSLSKHIHGDVAINDLFQSCQSHLTTLEQNVRKLGRLNKLLLDHVNEEIEGVANKIKQP